MVVSAIFAVVLPLVRWFSVQYCVKAILNAEAPTEFPMGGISNPKSWNWWWRLSTVSGPPHRASLTRRNARPSSKATVAHLALRQSSLSTWPQTAMGKKTKLQAYKSHTGKLTAKIASHKFKKFTSDATKEMPRHGNGTSLYHPLTLKAIKSTTAKESLYKEKTVHDSVKLCFVQSCCISYTCNICIIAA